MRAKVLDLVNHWWRKEKSRLAVDPARMKPGQLQVLARNLLEQVRYHGDFSGSGGKHDTAYGAYHNVYYKVTSQSSSGRHEITPLHPAMIPLILEPSGYRPNSTDNVAQSTGRFPYETIWILAEFVKTGDEAQVKTIGFDRRQNATVRMACLLALYRAGHQYYTRPMMSLLEEETDLERRLILLLSLRWAGAEAVPVLLENMNDPNIEVATAAGCALTDVKPREAIPLFEKLLDRHHTSAPLLLYNALAEYKSAEARALMQRLLSDAVEGRKNSQHLYRLLYAYADAWDIPRSAYATGKDRDYRRQARLALAYTKEMVERREAEKRLLTAAAASLRIRVNVAEAIQAMRRQEYKRLLALQGDDIVTAEETQEAFRLLQAVTAEVDTLRKALADRAAQLEAMEQR